jgi:hypothetical protein
MQILNCPVCNGWGTNSLPVRKGYKTCQNCRGESVQLKEGNVLVYWDMPPLFDYAGRKRANTFKSVFIVLMIALVLFLIITLFILGNQAIRVL